MKTFNSDIKIPGRRRQAGTHLPRPLPDEGQHGPLEPLVQPRSSSSPGSRWPPASWRTCASRRSCTTRRPRPACLDNNEFEFIELKNIGDEHARSEQRLLTEWRHFRLRGQQRHDARSRQVRSGREEQAGLPVRYGSALSGLIAGEYQGKLSNSGEKVTLVDHGMGRSPNSRMATARAGRRPPMAAGTRSSRWIRPCSRSRRAR